MLFTVFTILNRTKLLTTLQLTGTRSTCKLKYIMDDPKTAYFHLLDGSDKFKVTFIYKNELVNVTRQFNFERSISETIEIFLSRVTKNLDKVVMNKLKKKRKQSGSDGEVGSVEVNAELFISGKNTTIPNSAICKDVFFSNEYSGNLILKLVGVDYVVAINSPWIDSISLPSSIMAGFPVYTNCFESRFTDKTLSQFIWMKSNSNCKELPLDKDKGLGEKDFLGLLEKSEGQSGMWSVASEGFIYIPTVNDIGLKLKLHCTPKNSSAVGPAVQCESVSVIEAGPGYCPFENRQLYTKFHSSLKSFRVVSYNILADAYSSTETAQNELFSYCPTYALSIDYRKQLFLKEILGYNADLICLQEVDTKVFLEDLVPVLGEQGLGGVHVKKSTINEGVCTFYSPSKFKFVEAQEAVLSEELVTKSYCSHILECVEKNKQLKDRITGLGTVALALVLESVEIPGEVLVVGNTHLYFHPDADHIRLLQSGIVTAFLSNIVENIQAKDPSKKVSLVFCGDFNSVPECGIYKLMTSKFVPADFKDWSSKPEEEVRDLSLSQPYNFESACGTPKFTNYTVGFADCLDYIYFQNDRLSVDMVVPLPSDDELQEHNAIPSVVFPSDHVALIADLRWKT